MTFSTIITTSLLGIASAAVTPGPAINTTFPLYATAATPTATEKPTTGTTQGSYTAVYSQVSATLTNSGGPIRGYRNALVAFPTQSLVKTPDNGVGTFGTIAAHATGATATRTFYQFTVTQLATLGVSTDGAAANDLNGATWVVCATTTDTKVCGGGVETNGGSTVIYGNYVGRVLMKAGNTDVTTATVMGAGTGYQLQFNEDLALASMYHNAYGATEITTGVSWCSAFDNKLLAAGTVVPLSATYGLTGHSKCSWVVTAADNTVGPSIKIKSSDYLNFYLHFVEWAGQAALATNAVMPTTDAADYFLGVYANGANGALHLNPLTAIGTSKAPTTNWSKNTLYTTASVTSPNNYLGGTIGSIKYFPGQNGDAKEVQTMSMDQMQVKSMYDMTTKVNDMFNTDNGAYEKLRTVYEDAKTAETARLADALKAAFEPVIAIPSRPCAPSRPMAYSGVSLDLGSATAYPATFTAAGTRGQLVVAYTGAGTSASAPDTKLAVGSVKAGFVYPTADTTASTKAVGSAGHVFGRLGQSDMTLPGNSAPFAWFTVATGSLSAMMVSAFPAADGDAGLDAATKFLRLEASASVWATLDSFKAPGQPGAPTAATTTNAKMLALGAASALVFATLA